MKILRAKQPGEKIKALISVHSKLELAQTNSALVKKTDSSGHFLIEQYLNSLQSYVRCVADGTGNSHILDRSNYYERVCNEVRHHLIDYRDKDHIRSQAFSRLSGAYQKFLSELKKRNPNQIRSCESDYQNLCVPLILLFNIL